MITAAACLRRWWMRGRGLLLPALLFITWNLMARRGGGYSFAFVTLPDMWRAARDLFGSGEAFVDVISSSWLVTTGWAIGSAAGVATGAALASFRPADRLFGPVLHAFRQIPTFAWIPLLGLWFGYGSGPKLILVCLAAYFPVVLNSYEGLRVIDPRHIETARVLGLHRWQTFRRVRLPAALPMILVGLRQALAFAWITTVGAEVFFSAGPGVGAMIEKAQVSGRMDIVVIGIMLVGLVGMATNAIFTSFARRLMRWKNL